MDIVEKALRFATKAHLGQTRKYHGEPYIEHPLRVCSIVRRVSNDPDMLAAAILHDVVEDTEVTSDQILKEFGSVIASYVDDLTDVSRPEDGNRATRVRIDIEHTAKGHPNSKTIKIADVLDNLSDIVENDPKFAKKYCREKEELLHQSLDGGNPELWCELYELIGMIKEGWQDG